MSRQIPPLNALRAFEAGARYLNFTRAAEDLSVTQTAVSHQVRTLEGWFDKRLFVRKGKGLELTEAGAALYPVITQALDQISEVTTRVRGAVQRRTLTVSVTPTFGSRWLAQRLGRFWQELPDIDLRLHHSFHLADLAREDVDIAIRHGTGDWPGLTVERLMTAQTAAICSPKLLEGQHGIRTPADLRHHTLLHERDYREWTEWLMAAGVAEVDAQRGPIIDNSTALFNAALEGHGVLLGIPEMLSEELEAGTLVMPFGSTPDPNLAYYIAYLPDAIERPKVKAFRDFVMDEIQHGQDNAHIEDRFSPPR